MATSADKLREYEQLFQQSQAYDPARFASEFEKAYGEATNYNKDLIDQQASSIGRLQAVAPEMSQRYSTSLIKDPTAQRALIAQAREMPITDYTSAVNLLGQRGQRYADIFGKASNQYNSDATRAQTAAENAWRLYQDILAQEEAARARAAAASASSRFSLADLFNRGGQDQTQEEIDITVPDSEPNKSNWTQNLAKSYTKPINNNQTGITNNPFSTVTNLIGNLIGNRNQKDLSFWDKLLNRK